LLTGAEVVPRNKFVAEMLNRDGLATLLVDLLTPEEPGTLEEVAKLASGWFRCFFQIEDHKLS